MTFVIYFLANCIFNGSIGCLMGLAICALVYEENPKSENVGTMLIMASCILIGISAGAIITLKGTF